MPTKGIVSVFELKKKKKKKKKERKKASCRYAFFFIVYYAFVMFASFSGQSGLQLKKHLCLEHQHTVRSDVEERVAEECLAWNDKNIPVWPKNISVFWNFGPLHSTVYEIRTW